MLTTTQAAQFLRVSVRRVQALVAGGRLPATRVNGDWWLAEADVVAYAASRRTGRPLGWRKVKRDALPR